MTHDASIEEDDLRVFALLQDLAALDAAKTGSPAERKAQLRSALEGVEALDARGGGSLGVEKLAALRDALVEELEMLEGTDGT